MEIKGINSQYKVYNDSKSVSKNKTEELKETKNKSDRLELSDAAKKLNSASEMEPKAVEKYREKVESGFYNREEVIEKAAASILKEFS